MEDISSSSYEAKACMDKIVSIQHMRISDVTIDSEEAYIKARQLLSVVHQEMIFVTYLILHSLRLFPTTR